MSKCEVQDQASFTLVLVEGEVDMSWSNDLRQTILGPLNEGRPVMVELSAVKYIDSSGIAALVEGYQKAKAAGTSFGLVAASDPVRSVLELARLDQVFPMYENLEQAEASLG